MQIIHENGFRNYDVINDVTAWRQSQPSIFMFKWNCHIFHDNSNTVSDMITKLYVPRYHGHAIMPSDNCDNNVIDDVMRSKSRSNFEIAITSSIFKLERRSKAQNVGESHGYLDSILNFLWHFWRKFSPRPQNFILKILQFSI